MQKLIIDTNVIVSAWLGDKGDFGDEGSRVDELD